MLSDIMFQVVNDKPTNTTGASKLVHKRLGGQIFDGGGAGASRTAAQCPLLF